ncbi:uncharacterized protein EI90DRAFT_3035956 [Cantharellus anzutake]|uniref:uncharacterized protein n=1 Tax=Cantharellus anzutake TaxID=1750568 RepID=UPI001906FBF8|nr:uncharacterized protein EI90DRAFT_3035956 [Cantharellus anzutake]KAF8340549.1 hypothetical protein EI90DRAFT_3035956 [Cantharellus anzutake]
MLFTTSPASETMDGYPVYKAEGLAEDFTQLLGVVKNFPWNRKPTFEMLAPVLRAAKLHDFPHELDWATKSLADLFPEMTDSKAEFPLTPRPFAAKAAALAEECGLDDVLKPALYDLLRQPSFGLNPRSTRVSHSDISFASQGLKDRHILGLIRARETMVLKWTEMCDPSACSHDNGAQPSNMCTCATMFGDGNAEGIETARAEVWVRNIYSNPPTTVLEILKKRRAAPMGRSKDETHDSATLFSIGLLDILLGIDLLIETDWSKLECAHCVKQRKRAWQRERGRVWNTLGSEKAFDLRITETIDSSDEDEE